MKHELLPCPFCGIIPLQPEKSYWPPEVDISCTNTDCHVRPSVSQHVECFRNEGEAETYTPLFDKAILSLVTKWNKRI